jgi:hypothetical protein
MGDRLSPPRVRTLRLIMKVINQLIRSFAFTFWASCSESAGLGYATLAAQKGRRKLFSWLRVPQLRFRCFSSANSGLLPSGIERRMVMIVSFKRMWKEAVMCFNILNKIPTVRAVSGSNLGPKAGFN